MSKVRRAIATAMVIVCFAMPALGHTASHTSCESAHSGITTEGQWGHNTSRVYDNGNIWVKKYHYYYGPGPGRGEPIYKHTTATVCGHT